MIAYAIETFPVWTGHTHEYVSLIRQSTPTQRGVILHRILPQPTEQAAEQAALAWCRTRRI